MDQCLTDSKPALTVGRSNSPGFSGKSAGSIQVMNLSRMFGKHQALDSVSLNIAGGEMVALLGSSGAGKSTLLRHIAGLTPADRSSGAILVGGKQIQSGGKISRDIRRLRSGIGFVFQQFNLVNRLSLLTNVLVGHLHRMPVQRRLLSWFTHQEKQKAMEALAFLGLAGHAKQRAGTLSGGQQQRAAIARTMVQGAQVILADEPIASLDPEAARLVMDGLRAVNQREGVTVVVSVHQIDHAKRSCERVIALRQGKVCLDSRVEDLEDEAIRQLYEREIDAHDSQ